MGKVAKYVIFLCLLTLISVVGGVIFVDKSLSWIILTAAILICALFFTAFECRQISPAEISVIAVLTAISILGRLAFAGIPAFKPCSAVIIIAGIYFGAQNGFMVGALTAFVSNFYFSQGMWTPFQMIIWGLTGFFAGLFWKILSESRLALAVFGAVSGAVFSFFMDFWSAIWADNSFVLSRFLTLISTSAWFTLCYAVSNVIFLMIFISPAKRIFNRLSLKYNIGRKDGCGKI
jgi:energy-coupling factor transport system substrate-specific component